jgi:hypothetical protein
LDLKSPQDHAASTRLSLGGSNIHGICVYTFIGYNFLITTQIFDPIRVLMVEGKMLDWFDFRKFKIYHWLQANTLDRLRGSHFKNTAGPSAIENGWKERKDAETAINAYLADLPSMFSF